MHGGAYGETRRQRLVDWHGCEAVQFDPEVMGGKATVGRSRMDADGVLINYEGGLSIDEIVDSFELDRGAVEKIIAFAEIRQRKATA